MSFLLLLNGPFASGKSTVAHLLAERISNVSTIDWDDINNWLYVDNSFSKKSLRFKILLGAVEASAKSGLSIIVPNTICDTKKIEMLERTADKSDLTFRHIILTCNKDELKQRMSNRSRNDSITDESFERTNEELEFIKTLKGVTLVDSSNSPNVVAKKIAVILQQKLS